MSEKKTYEIVYTETLEHHFEVEANSPEEAKKIFENSSGEFDFSYGAIIDTSTVVKGNNTPDKNFFRYEAFCNEVSNNIRGACVYGNNIHDNPYVECAVVCDAFINSVKKLLTTFGYKIIEEHECEGSDYPSYCIWFGETEQ